MVRRNWSGVALLVVVVIDVATVWLLHSRHQGLTQLSQDAARADLAIVIVNVLLVAACVIVARVGDSAGRSESASLFAGGDSGSHHPLPTNEHAGQARRRPAPSAEAGLEEFPSESEVEQRRRVG